MNIKITCTFCIFFPQYQSTACSDTGDRANYLCEWSPQIRKIVRAVDANNAFAHLVVSFYETKFDFLHGVAPTLNGLNGNFYLTRAVERWAIDSNISFDPKILVVRNMALERQILNPHQSAAPIHRRRNTVATFKKVANIPFGARGRKRQTTNIAYVGIQPNPDGRKLVTQTPNNAASTSSGVAAPKMRTYARSKSMSLPSGPTTMSQENAMPSQSQTIDEPTSSNAPNNSTFDFDSFDSTTMGRLNYSSSDSD